MFYNTEGCGMNPKGAKKMAFIFRVTFVFGLFVSVSAGLPAQNDVSALFPYPLSDTYEGYTQYVKSFSESRSDTNIPIDWEPFRGLIQAKRYDGVYLLTRALHDLAPEKNYCLGGGLFINPINLAYEAKQFDLVLKLIAFDKALVSLPDAGIQAYYLEPLATAVVNNDTRWAEIFLKAGADVNTGYVKNSRNGSYPANLLTVSPSKEMDEFLLKRNIHSMFVLETPQEGKCNDDDVRLRSDPGVKGKILGKLMKGDTFKVLATTYKLDTIGTLSGSWVEVSFNDQIGWIFEPFVSCDYLDFP